MKLTLLVIANHASGSGVSFLGRKRMAEEACCRPETITANLRKLEDDGHLKRFQRRRANGSRTSDWIVLAPEAHDRAPLKDALDDEDSDPPELIRAAARKSSGEDFSPELFAPGQVRNSGGPEPSVERTASSSAAARKAADATTEAMLRISELPLEVQCDALELLRSRSKVGTRLVTPQEMVIAATVVAAFNEQSGGNAGLGANLTGIVGRIRERPSFDADAHLRLVQSAFRLRWWERDGSRKGPAPAVIYGSATVFERVIADATNEKAGKKPEEATGRYVRKGPRIGSPERPR